MSKVIIAVAFLALLYVFSALDLENYLYATENKSLLRNVSVTLDSTAYTVVTLTGKDILVIKADNLVRNQTEIENVLRQRCFISSYPSSSDLDSISSNTQIFNDSRNSPTNFGPAEDTCVRYVGQDKADCYDLTSCNNACAFDYSCFTISQGVGLDFFDSLLKFANIRKGLNGNVSAIISTVSELKSVTSASQLTFSFSSKLTSISDKVGILNSLAKNMTLLMIMKSPSAGGYGVCSLFVPAFNTSALSAVLTTTTILSGKTACFDSVSTAARNLLNETNSRVDYYTGTKQKSNLQSRYDDLMARYSGLSANVTGMNTIFNDPTLNAFIIDIDNSSALFIQEMNAGQADQAGLDLSLLDSKISDLENYLLSVGSSYADLQTARVGAKKALDKADIAVTADGALLSDVNNQWAKYNNQESILTSKITYEQTNTSIALYLGIEGNVSAALASRKAIESERAQSVVASSLRGVSLTVLNVISGPMGIRESEKRSWMSSIPKVLIFIMDIIAVAAFAVAFFLLVWRKTQEFMRKKIMMTWVAIFIFFILLVAGVSYALTSILGTETDRIGFYSFLPNLEKSNETIAIFMERSSTENAGPMQACATAIADKLAALNKTSVTIDVVDGVCNETILSECLAKLGSAPLIDLKYASKNETSFYSFYRVEADITGDEAYFNTCTVADLIN